MNGLSYTFMAVPVGAYLSLFLLERWLPLRAPTRTLWRRLIVNVAISALGFGAAVIFVRPAAAAPQLRSCARIQIGEHVGIGGIFVVVEAEVLAAPVAKHITVAVGHRQVMDETGLEVEVPDQEYLLVGRPEVVWPMFGRTSSRTRGERHSRFSVNLSGASTVSLSQTRIGHTTTPQNKAGKSGFDSHQRLF